MATTMIRCTRVSSPVSAVADMPASPRCKGGRVAVDAPPAFNESAPMNRVSAAEIEDDAGQMSLRSADG